LIRCIVYFGRTLVAVASDFDLGRHVAKPEGGRLPWQLVITLGIGLVIAIFAYGMPVKLAGLSRFYMVLLTV